MSPLWDGKFDMTVAFVQNSTTCILQINTKLDGKYKLHLPSFLVWNSMKGNGDNWTKGDSWTNGVSWTNGDSWTNGVSWTNGDSWTNCDSWTHGDSWTNSATWTNGVSWTNVSE